MNDLLAQITSKFNKEVAKDPNIVTEKEGEYVLSFIPYGVPTLPMLELAIGRPGYPAGKIIELYGEPHSGKTTLAYHAMAALQKLNPDAIAVFIDTEQSWDPDRATECGVEVTRVLVTSAKTIESIIRILEKQFKIFRELKERPPIIMVVDSITGVPTEYEQDKEFVAETRVGHEAKQIRGGLKKINAQLAELKIPMILVNHVMSNIPKGNVPVKATQSSGGKSPKFFAAVRLEVKRKGDQTKQYKGVRIKTAQDTVIKIDKNKVNSPRIMQIDKLVLTNEYGFDHVGNLLDALWFVDVVKMPTKDKVYSLPSIVDSEPDREFLKEDWPQVMLELGGYDTMLEVMRTKAMETGWMKPYGIKKLE